MSNCTNNIQIFLQIHDLYILQHTYVHELSSCSLCMYMTCPLSACVQPQKTRVSSFLELQNFWPFRPLLPLSHQPVTTVTVYHIISNHMQICTMSSMKHLQQPMHVPHAYIIIQHRYPSTKYSTQSISIRTISYVPYIRVFLTQPTNQHIPYPSTRPTISRMPQAFTIS
jgi:hypothetical protein